MGPRPRWDNVPQRNVLPLRKDGTLSQGYHSGPQRWLATENRMNATANHRQAPTGNHKQATARKDFATHFRRSNVLDAKAAQASARVRQDGKYVEASLASVMNGAPGGFASRQDTPPTDKPLFKTRLAAVWPKGERAFNVLDNGAKHLSTRLAATENFHPASRMVPPSSAFFRKFESPA